MKRSWGISIVTVVVGLAAFLAGPHIWPMGPDVPMPPANLLPGYIVLSAIKALAFGFAVAFAIFGWPAMPRLEPWRAMGQQMDVRHSLLVHGELVGARQSAHAQRPQHEWPNLY